MKVRTGKLDKIKATNDVDGFLITSLSSVKYFCGYFYDFDIGSSPFQLIPAALFISPSRKISLIIADNEADQITETDPGITVLPYSSYTYEEPLKFNSDFLEKITRVVGEGGPGNIRLGIEANSLPYSIAEHLSSKYPELEFVDISNELSRVRMIKEEDEILSIRAATRLCDIGQEAVLKYAEPDMTELELFTLVRGDMEVAAGKRFPMMADLVSGVRTFSAGGNPSPKKIESGDIILSDLTPCLNGYWGDTCNSMVLGKPSPEQKEHFKLVQETLWKAINAVKPGIRANEIDQIMRTNLAPAGGFDHHGGHGVGVRYHEEPRIVPYNDIYLEPDMVIALEPGIYTNGYGIRLEHLVLVTKSGCEIISGFKHRFEK